MQYSLVIVDDHVLIARAIGNMVDEFPNYTSLYVVENGQALIERFRSPTSIPDIVLLDIAMPIMDGFETAQWLKDNHPDVLVLALTMQDDDRSLIRMIKCGAKGYLLKTVEPNELKNALDHLVSQGFYYPEWVAGKVFMNMADDNLKTTETHLFTDREEEFLQYCCTEMSYKEIGEKMFVSSRTVEGYRDSCCEKTDIRTRVGLAVWAIKTGRVIL